MSSSFSPDNFLPFTYTAYFSTPSTFISPLANLSFLRVNPMRLREFSGALAGVAST